MILIDQIDIYYDSDQFDLTVGHDSLLTEFFDYQNTSELEFHIDSYTDVDGDEIYNKQLSDQRTASIVSWLSDHMVDEERILTEGHGEQYARDAEDVSKAKDRRSEIKVFQRTPYKLFQGRVDGGGDAPLVGLEISVYDNGIRRRITVDSGSSFSVPVPLSREVELQFEAENYFPEVKILRLSPRANVSNIILPMVKMAPGAKATLHVQFVGGKSIVLDRYKNRLFTLSSILRKSPDICLELAGHINEPGTEIVERSERSFGLSIARSIEIHDFLVEHGIDRDRLLARGYGNSKMTYPNATSERAMSANRRVEAIVMSCDSTRIIPNDFVKNLSAFRQVSVIER